jgi:hypothetical protein
MDLLELDENREIYREFMEVLLKQVPMSAPEPVAAIHTAESLPSIMSYTEVETLAFHLSLQLRVLERRDCSLLFWQSGDILFVNKKLYLLANLMNLVSIKSDQIVLNYPAIFPFPKSVCAPELLKMKALPFITHKSLSYYSLALMCLQKLNLSLEELKGTLHGTLHGTLQGTLHGTLQGTKLFYFLERCLKEEPSERVLINL